MGSLIVGLGVGFLMLLPFITLALFTLFVVFLILYSFVNWVVPRFSKARPREIISEIQQKVTSR